jgi:hypothetical protein
MRGGEQTARLPTGLVASITLWALACGAAKSADDWHFDAQGRAQVDIRYDCQSGAPLQALSAAGFTAGTSVKLAKWCVIEGWLPVDSLARIASIPGVKRVQAPSYAIHPRLSPSASRPSIHLTPRPDAGTSAGGVDQDGISILGADQFMSQTGTDGTGVKVGVQSSGVSSLQTIKTRGELPSVQLLTPEDGAASQTGDEGTVLLEELHAVAPGASLAYCGPSTFVEFTSCLGKLIDAGVTILVDDLIFPQQDLLSADSSGVQAIEQLLAANPQVMMFTAGGNYNGSYWEGNYSPVSVASLGIGSAGTGTPLSCTTGSSTQTDNYVTRFDSMGAANQLTVVQAQSVPIAFTWGDPPDQNASHYDVYWFVGTTQIGCFSTATLSASRIAKNISFGASTYTLYIGTPDASGAGQFLKLWVGGDGLTSLSKSTSGSIVTPQALAAGVVTVGAVNGSDGVGNSIEPFSSIGPITVLFPAAAQIQAPVLVAPDGIKVDAAGTYFQGSLFPDGNFYGTSAAVPNAAGVAALVRSAFPSLTAAQLIESLKAGSAQLGATLPDGTFGYGRVDAMGTLAVLGGPPPMPPPTTPPTTSQTDSPPAASSGGGGGGGALDWLTLAVLLFCAGRPLGPRIVSALAASFRHN